MPCGIELYVIKIICDQEDQESMDGHGILTRRCVPPSGGASVVENELRVVALRDSPHWICIPPPFLHHQRPAALVPQPLGVGLQGFGWRTQKERTWF